MNTFHIKCNGEAYIDISDFFEIQTRLDNYDHRNRTIFISDLRLDIVKKDSIKIEFTCAKCGEKHISLDDVAGSCGICGEITPLNKLTFSIRHNVTSCPKTSCISKINRHEVAPFISILKKISA